MDPLYSDKEDPMAFEPSNKALGSDAMVDVPIRHQHRIAIEGDNMIITCDLFQGDKAWHASTSIRKDSLDNYSLGALELIGFSLKDTFFRVNREYKAAKSGGA